MSDGGPSRNPNFYIRAFELEHPIYKIYTHNAGGLSFEELYRSLQRIIKFPPTCAIQQEKQLVWKVCFSLMPEKKALTKSTCLVNLCYIQEAKQAVELIEKWEAIDVADALELLPPDSENLEASYLVPLCILPFFLDVYVIRCPHIFLDLFMQKTFCWSYTYFVSPFLLFSELCGCSGVSHDFFV